VTYVLALNVPEAGGAVTTGLTPGQLATLLGARDLVEVGPLPGGQWRITGRRRIGALRLGRGDDAIDLYLRPKLPISSLMFLLSYTAGDRHWRQNVVTTGAETELMPAVAELFVRMASQTLNGGVLHGYRPIRESLHALRGRLDVSEQLRRGGLPLPVAVEYDEFTADIPENRILAATIVRLTSLHGVPPATSAALRHLAGRLVGVSIPAPGAPPPAWKANRLNERYTATLSLAELILSGTVPDVRHGDSVAVHGIVIDMERLFERFLETAFRDAARLYGMRCLRQHVHHFDAACVIEIRPDISVHRTDGLHSVVDAKYKTSDGVPNDPADLYQLTAYCTALGLKAGHLVYANGPAEPVTHVVGFTGTTITVHGLNLSAAPARILETVACIAEFVSCGDAPHGASRNLAAA
jgi:5-methylcytosine-specific restriction enzyme subunit McrC